MAQIKYKIDGVMDKQALVKQSIRNMNRTLTFQAEMSDMETESDEMSDKEQIQAAIKSNEQVVAYLADVLGLDAEQTDALYDLSQEEAIEHMVYLTRRIMGETDQEIKESEEKDATEGLTETTE